MREQEDEFTLRNDRPPRRRPTIEPSDRRRQAMIFRGLDLLPGQLDFTEDDDDE